MAPGQRKRVQSRRNQKKQPDDDVVADDYVEPPSDTRARGKRAAEDKSAVCPDKSTVLKIAGYDVKFPHEKPYKAQVLLMFKVLDTLKNSTADRTGSCNAILESPTGTGKTLAMLSAVLAWQQREKTNASACTNFSNGQGSASGCEAGGQKACCGSEQEPRDGQGAAQTPAFGVRQGEDGTSRGRSQFDVDALTGAGPEQGDGGNPYDSGGGFLRGPAGATASMAGSSIHEDTAGQLADGRKKAPAPPPRPRIFYTTRTHSQITQVCAELKRCTGYKATMTILAARKHLCCNKEVSKKPEVDEVCKDLLRSMSTSEGCQYYRNVKVLRAHKALQPDGRLRVHNIEDLRELGQRVKGCAYFLSRAAVTDCDIILCPYTYLLSPRIRGTLDVTLKGAVVIIDEAHNIEETARESASVALPLADLRTARAELRVLAESDQHPKGLSKGRRGGREAGPETPQQETYQALTDLLLEVINWLQAFISAPPLGGAQAAAYSEHGQGAQSTTIRIFSGDGILAELSKAGIQRSQFELLLQHFNKVIAGPRGSGAGQEEGEEGQGPPDASGLSGHCAGILEGLFTGLRFMLSDGCRHLPAFRMVITREEGDSRVQSSAPTERSVTLNLWCMDPGVAFEDMAVNCRAVLLMSGTLSPMESLALELGAPFPKNWRMEGQHVIDASKQLWAGVLPFGPKGRCLNGSFAQASALPFQEEVGEALLQLCEVVPEGVLVFFRSFHLMNTLIARWKGTGILPKIAALKTIFEEPRGVEEGALESFLKRYKVAAARVTAKPGKGRQLHAGAGAVKGLQNGGGAGGEVQPNSTNGVASGPARRRRAKGGAIMFAVFRGKISEGIDFSDSAARAVVVVGIPYPNSKDQQVVLKKAYNDERCNRSAAERYKSGQAPQQSQHLSGAAWYTQGAFRALNQAIGRVIRHQNDYGAVILLDERLSNAGSQDQISKWVRGQLRVHQNFAEAKDQLQDFFSRAEDEFPARGGPGFKPPAARGALSLGAGGAGQPTTSAAASPHKSAGARIRDQGGAGSKGSAAERHSGDMDSASASLGSTEPSVSRGSIEDFWQRRRRSTSNSGGTTSLLGRTQEEEDDEGEEGEEVLSAHSPAVAPEAKGGKGAGTTSKEGQDPRLSNQSMPAAPGGHGGGARTGGSSMLAPPQGEPQLQAPKRGFRPPVSLQHQQRGSAALQDEPQPGGPKAQGAGQSRTSSRGAARDKDWIKTIFHEQVQDWQKKEAHDRPEAVAGQVLEKPSWGKGHPGTVQAGGYDPGPRAASGAATRATGFPHGRTQGTLESTTPFPTPHREQEARLAPSSTPSTAMGAPSLHFSPTSTVSAQSVPRLTIASDCQLSDPRSAWGIPPKVPQYHSASGLLGTNNAPTPTRLEHAFGRVATSIPHGEQSPEKFQSSSSHAPGYGGGRQDPMCQSPGQEKLQGRGAVSPLARRLGQGCVPEEGAGARRDSWGSDEKENAGPPHKRLRDDPYARSQGITEAVLATQRYSPGAGSMGPPNPLRELETQAVSSLSKQSLGQGRPTQHVTQTTQSASTAPAAPEGPASGGSTAAAACTSCGSQVVSVQAQSGALAVSGIPVISLSKTFLVGLLREADSRTNVQSNAPGHGSVTLTGVRAGPSRPPTSAPAATPAPKPERVKVRAVDAALCSWGSEGGGVEMGEEVWVKEDGCVFSPIYCKGCQTQQQSCHQPMGVLVLAANTSNKHINGKALLFNDNTKWTTPVPDRT